jgi:hypothetical protein
VETTISVKILCKLQQKKCLHSKKNHTYRWYDDTQPSKISYTNSVSFVRYKHNKFITNHLNNFRSGLKFVDDTMIH